MLKRYECIGSIIVQVLVIFFLKVGISRAYPIRVGMVPCSVITVKSGLKIV